MEKWIRKLFGFGIIVLVFLSVSYLTTGSIQQGVTGLLFTFGATLFLLAVGTAVYFIVS